MSFRKKKKKIQRARQVRDGVVRNIDEVQPPTEGLGTSLDLIINTLEHAREGFACCCRMGQNVIR